MRCDVDRLRIDVPWSVRTRCASPGFHPSGVELMHVFVRAEHFPHPMLHPHSTSCYRAASKHITTLLHRRVFPAFVLGALLVGCAAHHEEEHEGHEQGRYPVTTPLLTDTVVARDYVCQIHSVQHIELRALEKGYLQDMLVDEGQQVREGQLLFRIRPVLYQAEVQRATGRGRVRRDRIPQHQEPGR